MDAMVGEGVQPPKITADKAASELQGGRVDAVEFFATAGDFYAMLASIFYLELTPEQIEGLAEAGFQYPDDGSEMAKACKELRLYLNRRGPNARQDLAVDYARIFLAAGVYDGETAVPYESVYTSDEGILMQDARDDVVRIYKENGLVIPRDLNVPEDHLAFELEFMAHLSRRIAEALDQGPSEEGASRLQTLVGTQLSFIDNHLLNWIPDLERRVEAFAKHRFYPAILKVTESFIRENRLVCKELMAESEA